jgi:hypothetical protein
MPAAFSFHLGCLVAREQAFSRQIDGNNGLLPFNGHNAPLVAYKLLDLLDESANEEMLSCSTAQKSVTQ